MSEEIIMDALPALGLVYVRAVVQRRERPDPTTECPALCARVRRVDPDPEELREYRAICGIADDGALPPTYPQVLATPLHAAIVAHADFPLPALGMVHLENRIRQHAPIDEGATLDMECRLSGWRWDERLGVKFAIETTVRVLGEVVWESELWALSRGKKEALIRKDKSGRRRKKQKPGEPPDCKVSVIFDASADLGRRYAAVCGDYNPIHLHPMTARPFGFRQPIIHGMWTLARCWAEIADQIDTGELEMTVRFKRPLYLPSKALISVRSVGDEELEYRCQSPAGEVLFLEGKVTY